MYILTFDTTTEIDSCSVVDLDGKILSNISMTSIQQSEGIIDLIDFTIKSARIDKKDISVIATCSGPGSYVGARIGLSTLIGLSKSLKVRIECFNLFDILNFDNNFLPFIEKRGKFYTYSDDIKEITEEYIQSYESELISDEIGSIEQKNIRYIDDSLTRSLKMATMIVEDSKKSKRDIKALYL